MTREQIIAVYTDLGQEAPVKGVVTSLLNAFNQEKAKDIETAEKTARDEAEAKYKGYIKPEDHQKIVDELNAEKGKGALAERKAKYKEAKLNIDDEDVLSLIEAKLKDSKEFDKDLAEYVKAHPSFIKQEVKEDKGKNPNPAPKQEKVITVGGTGSDNGTQKINEFNLGDAIAEHYKN